MSILCEFDFQTPNPKNPTYAIREYDYYTLNEYRAADKGVRPHRLTLRRNLTTGQFEVYRHYLDDHSDDTIYSTDSLGRAICVAEQQYKRFTGSTKCPGDQICDHSENAKPNCKGA